MTTEAFETFDSMDSGDSEVFETFDNLTAPEESEEPKKETVKDDLKIIKDSQADSEGKVIKEDEEAEKEEKEEKKSKKSEKSKKEDEEEEVEEEETEELEESKSEKEDEEEKPKSKLRMKMGEELYNVESDATFKVKVDGKTLDVPVQELINNYSGKVAWDKKFTELGKEKKHLEVEKKQITKERDTLLEHVNKVIAPLKDKENGNPLESLLYLVEMSGEDPYNAYRRIMEANLNELSDLMDMSEVERELYFHKKKDDLHGKVAKNRMTRAEQERAFSQTLQKVDELRKSYNVTEDEFADASEELESLLKGQGLDTNQITAENIVDYASLKPHISKVQKLVLPFQDNIAEEKYGDVVSDLARNLRDGNLDEKAVTELLKRNFSVEEDVKELNTKVYSKKKVVSSKKYQEEDKSDKFETFDDL